MIPYLQPEEEEAMMDEKGAEEIERGTGEKRVFPATEKTDLESLIDLEEAMLSLSAITAITRRRSKRSRV